MAGCISCVVLPLLLFLFHRFIQPILLRFWNPWAQKEEKGIATEGRNGIACPFNKSINNEPPTENHHPPDPSRLKSE